MASNYTSNYGLCQWAERDKVLRTEFNADNAKIDAAIAAVNSRVSVLSGSSVSPSELNSLKSTVSSLQTTVNGLQTGKADKSALDSLKTTVGQHTSALAKTGHCLFYTTSYTGDGTCGEDHPTVLSFPHKPMVVFICIGVSRMTLVQGCAGSWNDHAGGGASTAVTVTWSGNSVRFFGKYNYTQMNETQTYSVLALLDAEH